MRLVLGYGALEMGLAFLPLTMAVAAVSLCSAGGLMLRYGAGDTLLPGLGLVTGGLLLFARAPVLGQYLLNVFPVMLVLGTGVGLGLAAVLDDSTAGQAGCGRAPIRAGRQADKEIIR